MSVDLQMVDAAISVSTHLVPTTANVLMATNWELTTTHAKVNFDFSIQSFN